MRDAFVKLHISIFLAGFTGLFGKWVTLNEGLLVWYRMFLAGLLLFIILLIAGKLHKTRLTDVCRIGGVGLLLGLHWVAFFGSIKAANVSIGVVCFSTVGFFTALLEPVIIHRRFLAKELLFSMIAVLGIMLIFHFDVRYRTGIILGIVSSALCALFTISNKRVGRNHSTSVMLLYEMIGGCLGLTCLSPVYLHYFPLTTLLPGVTDMGYLLLLAFVCTIGLYMLQIQVLQKVSAFTVNLSYNLEPVYSIILAMIFFGEAKELNLSFYGGIALIILSVLLQTREVLNSKRQ